MKNKSALIIFTCFLPIIAHAQNSSAPLHPMENSASHGICHSNGQCFCDKGYITPNAGPACSYKQKEQITALMLNVMLLGLFGAGEFYAGQYGYGAGQLVLATSAITLGSMALYAKTRMDQNDNVFGPNTKKVAIGLLALGSIAAIADVSWWIADCVRFGANEVLDENGYPLRPLKNDNT